MEGINTSATVCIKQVGCDITIATAPGSAGPGVSGDTAIGPLGGIMGANITQGTSMRSGCIGVWDPVKRELRITCGSTTLTCSDPMNTQCCTVILSPHTGGC
jgi:hypothetical protein